MTEKDEGKVAGEGNGNTDSGLPIENEKLKENADSDSSAGNDAAKTEGERENQPRVDSKGRIDNRSPEVIKRYSVGTLTYTKATLFIMFAWVLWGDFCFQLMEKLGGLSITGTYLMEKLDANLLTVKSLTFTLPMILGVILGPIISVKSDNLRSKYGRRIPFMLLTAPMLCFFLMGIGYADEIYNFFMDWVFIKQIGMEPKEATLMVLGFLIIGFAFFNEFVNTVWWYLFADVVPQAFIGRFLGLMRLVNALVGFFFSAFLFEHQLKYMSRIFTGAAMLYLVGFSLMCLFVKEGEYPPVDEKEKEAPLLDKVKLYFKECFFHPIYIFMYGSTVFNSLVIVGTVLGTYFFLHVGQHQQVRMLDDPDFKHYGYNNGYIHGGDITETIILPNPGRKDKLNKDGTLESLDEKVVTTSMDGTIKVLRWTRKKDNITPFKKVDYHSIKILKTIKAHDKAILSAVVLPGTDSIVTASADGTLKIWNYETGELVKELAGHGEEIFEVVASPGGGEIISASPNHIFVWNAKTGGKIGEIKGHDHKITALAISGDGKYIATADTEYENVAEKGEKEIIVPKKSIVKVWDAKNLKCVRTIEQDEKSAFGGSLMKGIKTMAFVPSFENPEVVERRKEQREVMNKLLASLKGKTEKDLRDPAVRAAIENFFMENIKNFYGVDEALRNKKAGDLTEKDREALARYNGMISSLLKLVDHVETAKTDRTVDLEPEQYNKHFRRAMVAFFPDLRENAINQLISPMVGEVLSEEELHYMSDMFKGAYEKASVSKKDRGFFGAIAYWSGVIKDKLVSAAVMSVTKTFNYCKNILAEDDVYTHVPDKDKYEVIDNAWLACGGEDRVLHVWDYKGNEMVMGMKGHQKTINCIMYKKDLDMMLTGSDDRSICVWPMVNYDPTKNDMSINRLLGYSYGVTSIASISQNGVKDPTVLSGECMAPPDDDVKETKLNFWSVKAGVTWHQIAIAHALAGLLMVALAYPFGMLVDKYNPVRIYTFMTGLLIVIQMVGYFVIYDYYSYIGLEFFRVFFYGIIGAAAYPVLMIIFPKKKFGQFCSAQGLCTQFTKAIGSILIGGLVFDWITHEKLYFDRMRIGYLFMGICYVGSFICLYMVYRIWMKNGGDKGYVAPLVDGSHLVADEGDDGKDGD